MLIGTSALNEVPDLMDSPRVKSQVRSPPEIMASTTSLIV
jgi:hypothetical protein